MPDLNRRRLLVALLASTAIAGIPRGAGRALGNTLPQTGGAVKAFDTAAYIGSATWFAYAYAEGYRLYIPNTTVWGRNKPWPYAASQLKMALDAGLMVAAYARNPSWWSAAIQACSPYIDKLQFFCLDIETNPGVRVTSAMVQGVTNLGVRPLIYTGSRMWTRVMGGNVTTFSSVPLWDANGSYNVPADFTPDIDSPTPVEFGGWNTPTNPRVGVQQGLSTNLNGVAVDVSSFSSTFLMPR